MTKVRVQTLNCNRCGYKWVPRKAVVYLCPKCKSPKWNEAERDEIV